LIELVFFTLQWAPRFPRGALAGYTFGQAVPGKPS
jgi:hypothetical protein